MAMMSYMNLVGNDTGEIKGDCKQDGREGAVVVYKIEHGVTIPTDVHTGLPTGQRQHKPFVIHKHKDQASPQMFQLCCTGERCNVEVKFYRLNDKGQEEHYYTVKLENAIIVEMGQYNPLVFLEENKPYPDMEEVKLTYESITWTYETDGIEAQDSWGKPKTA